MPLRVKTAEPLPPFTFSPGPPSPRPLDNDPPPPRPPADFIPERDMNMFGTMPLAGQREPGRGLVKCTRCGKPSMEWAAAEHKRICSHVLDGTPLTVKKGTKTTESKKRRASEAVSSESASPTKKRLKLPGSSVAGDTDGDTPASLKGLKKSQVKKMEKEQQRLEKKAQKEQEKKAVAERKRLRASNPLDLDRQCGVINDKGLPCSRSLTCKTHTVGAKRGVEGRSRPYDDLHLEWQRANNPNFREPPSKKEKEIRKAERARDRVVQKKKKVEWDEDDSETEEGLRELGDLIHIARMAGDRVSGHSGGRGGGGGYGSAIKGAWWGISGIGMGGVGRMGGVWRAATYEFAQVGEMFTKALASRKQAIPDVVEVRDAPKSGRAAPPPRIAINPASVHPTPQTVKHEQAHGAAGGDATGNNVAGAPRRSSNAGNQPGHSGGGKNANSNQGQNQSGADGQSTQIPGVPANMTAMLSNMSKVNRAAAAAAAAAANANGGNAGNSMPMTNPGNNANNNGGGGNPGFAPGSMNPNTMQALQAMAANFPGGINAMSNIQGLQNIPAVQAMQAMQAMQGAQGMQNMQNMQGIPGMQGMQGMQGMGGLPGMQGMQGMQGMPNMGNMGNMQGNMASMANMQQAAAAAAAMQQGGFQGMNFQGGGPGNGMNLALPNAMGQRMGGMPGMGQMGQMGQIPQMGQMGQMGQGQGMPEMLGQQGGGGGGQGQQQYQVSA